MEREQLFQQRGIARPCGQPGGHIGRQQHPPCIGAQGRMQPAGLAAFAARRTDRTGIYAFERDQAAELAPPEVDEFRRHPQAWQYFEAVAPSYRRVITHWVVSARQPATRARRFQQLLQACAEQRRILR